MKTRGRRPALGAVAALVALGATTMAGAEPPPTQSLADRGVPTFDVSGVQIANMPLGLAGDAEIRAMVEFDAAPAVDLVQQAAAKGKQLDLNTAAAQARANRGRAEGKVRQLAGTVLGSTDVVANTLAVRTTRANLQQIAATAGVARVQVSRQYRPNNAAAAKATGVPAAWQDLGLHGEGMKVAIIDTGVDYTHANFGGPGTVEAFNANDGSTIEDGFFPTAKVVGGYDFVGDAYDASSDDPALTVTHPDEDPLDCNGHGSHVAGTAAGSGVNADGSTYAGPYDAATFDKSFKVPPGAAPMASILAYKVFGCEGSVDDRVIVAAIERAVLDGADVINMSLGAPFGNAENVESGAIDRAIKAGTMVVASAGNDGPSAYTAGSPATSNNALSVSAIDAAFEKLDVLEIHLPGDATVAAQNSNEATVTEITGTLVNLGLGCDPAAYAAAAGQIALTTRGDCARVDRAIWGQAAGATAVIMINTDPGFPPIEGTIDGATIPFLGVAGADGAAVLAAAGQQVTIAVGGQIDNPGYKGFAGFTSTGLRVGDSALKPDISAPGVAILSTYVGSGSEGTRISGTSMAGPHTAGIATLVRQSHPDLDPLAIKGIMMGTANGDAITNFSPRRGGAGLVQAQAAVNAVAYPTTTNGLHNLSFGFDEIRGAHSESQTFTLHNTSATSITYDLAVRMDRNPNGAAVVNAPASVAVPAGGTADVEVSLSIPDPTKVLPAAASDAWTSPVAPLPAIEGRIIATPTTVTAATGPLTVPFAQMPNASSNVIATAGTASISLSNDGAITGGADVYQWTHTDGAGDNGDPLVPDIRSVGVQSFPDGKGDAMLVFAVNYEKSFSTHATNEVDILINVDGTAAPEFLLVAVDEGLLKTGYVSGVVHAFMIDLKTNSVVSETPVSAPANGSTVLIPTFLSATKLKGVSGQGTSFSFTVATYSIMDSALAPDTTGWATFRPFKPAVSVGGYADVTAGGGTASIRVGVDKTEVSKQGALGWLVVTQDDAGGTAEADTVAIRRG